MNVLMDVHQASCIAQKRHGCGPLVPGDLGEEGVPQKHLHVVIV